MNANLKKSSLRYLIYLILKIDEYNEKKCGYVKLYTEKLKKEEIEVRTNYF